MRLKLVYILIGLFLAVPPVQHVQAQKVATKRKLKKQSKKNAKHAEKSEKSDAAVSEELRKQHYKNQTKQVKKRLKKNKRKAQRYNNHKREFFAVRWWRWIEYKVSSIFK
ncbi:hypothetical protein KFE98_10805 [bacterium SCSIO 12741]|nr:hypothetical protein KFE98_10805 [bacterium SCSIO 12741]